jgi:hypothetical protein
VREGEHFCDAKLLPGECIVCVGKPRPFVRIESWAGSHAVDVEILGRTAKRTRVRFLSDCQKGERGAVRLVRPDAVFRRTIAL